MGHEIEIDTSELYETPNEDQTGRIKLAVITIPAWLCNEPPLTVYGLGYDDALNQLTQLISQSQGLDSVYNFGAMSMDPSTGRL